MAAAQMCVKPPALACVSFVCTSNVHVPEAQSPKALSWCSLVEEGIVRSLESSHQEGINKVSRTLVSFYESRILWKRQVWLQASL